MELNLENIVSVKKLNNNYIVNDGLLIVPINDSNNRHNFIIKKWLENNSLIDIDINIIKNDKILSIKQEAQNRINQLYSDFKQRNILMGQDSINISKMNNDILAVRNKSNEIEQSLETKTLDELNLLDIRDNNLWI